MAQVILTARVYSSNKKIQAVRNRNNVNYIGSRKGVVLNEKVEHGLFGRIMGQKAEEQQIEDITRQIEKKSCEGKHMYRIVMSLKEEDAIKKGYNEAESWKKLLERQLPKMAKKLNMKMETLEYVAAVHMEKGHPHMHIMLYSDAEEIRKAYINPKTSNAMRADFAKDILSDEINVLNEMKNEARKASTNEAEDFFSKFLTGFSHMTQADVDNASIKLKESEELADERIMYNKFDADDINDLKDEFFALKEALPKKGRLTVKFLAQEFSNNNPEEKQEKEVTNEVEIVEQYEDDELRSGDIVQNLERGNLGKVINISEEESQIFFVNRRTGNQAAVWIKNEMLEKLKGKELLSAIENMNKPIEAEEKNNKQIDPLKAQLRSFTLKMIEINSDMKIEVEKYCDMAKKQAKLYSEDDKKIEKAYENAKEDILKRIDNKILSEISKMNKAESYSESEKRHAMESLMSNIFSMLTRTNSANGAKMKNNKGDMTKSEKRQLAKKLKENNIDWEM